MIETNPKLGEKNRGVGIKHHGVCIEFRNQPKTRQQTRNSETKNHGVDVKQQTQNSITNLLRFPFAMNIIANE